MQKISIQEFTKAMTNVEKPSTNHVLVVDCSGSMYDSLPKLRTYIKANLSLLVKPSDTVSILYFSSRGEFGVIFENRTINDLQDLNALQKSIDRLKPMGCTGFKEPIAEAMDVVKRIGNSKLNNFVFMTDGYDNEWREEEILSVCKNLPTYFSDVTFIEYGWYCNRKLLEKMAAISNGLLVFSENYQECEETFQKSITSENMKKVAYKVEGGNKVIYYKNQEIVVLNVVNGEVLIPENLDRLFIIPDDYTIEDSSLEIQYTMLYHEIQRAKTNEAWKILKVLGDVKIINEYSTCFSKQDYSNLLTFVKECVFDESKRFLDGKDTNLVPKEDAYTVIDLLNDLVDGENKLMITSEHFQYSRIGAKTEAKSAIDKISELQEEMKNTTDVEKIKEIALQITEIQETVNFTAIGLENGVDMNNIVWNENRPNVSINTMQRGFVTLPEAQAKKFNLPIEFPTHIFRNYTIVKDGIKNVKVLPVKLCEKTFELLCEKGVIEKTSYQSDKVYLVDINKVPVINRIMVKELSAKSFVETYFDLLDKKAKQKVLKHLLDDKEKALKGLIETYGEEAAQYLESIGVKDYGFSPKVTTIKGEDVYLSKELNVKISGLSSLPSINAVLKKGSGKMNLADSLIKRYLDLYEVHKDNKALLTTETENCIKEVRKLQKAYNQTMYAIIIGQVWFKEFASIDENTISMNFGEFKDTKCQIILEEKEITI